MVGMVLFIYFLDSKVLMPKYNTMKHSLFRLLSLLHPIVLFRQTISCQFSDKPNQVLQSQNSIKTFLKKNYEYKEKFSRDANQIIFFSLGLCNVYANDV